MDVAVTVHMLDGSHLTVPATQSMLVRDLKAAVVARLCLRPLEAATCGFFQISAQGLDIFVSEDTMLVDIYSPRNKLIKCLLFTLIVPDVSGVRAVVEDSKLRAKCSIPDYYSECSAVYKGMLIHHALDKIHRGHVLAHSDRLLENTSDLCCYFIAVKYGALILELNQHIIPSKYPRLWSRLPGTLRLLLSLQCKKFIGMLGLFSSIHRRRQYYQTFCTVSRSWRSMIRYQFRPSGLVI